MNEAYSGPKNATRNPFGHRGGPSFERPELLKNFSPAVAPGTPCEAITPAGQF